MTKPASQEQIDALKAIIISVTGLSDFTKKALLYLVEQSDRLTKTVSMKDCSEILKQLCREVENMRNRIGLDDQFDNLGINGFHFRGWHISGHTYAIGLVTLVRCYDRVEKQMGFPVRYINAIELPAPSEP